MSSISKLKGISKLNNITSKLRRKFGYDLSTGVKYYTNKQGHQEYNREVS